MDRQSKVDELIEVIKVECDLANALRDISEEKRKALLDMDGPALAGCTGRELEIIGPLQALEQERIRRSADLDRSLRDRQSGPAGEGEPELMKLEAIKEQLRSIVREILTANELNRILLEHSREYIRENLRLVTGNFVLQLVDRKG